MGIFSMSAKTQDEVMRICSTVVAVLSMAGASYIILRYWLARRRRTAKSQPNVMNELIHILAWFDLLISFAHVASIYPARTYNAKLHETPTAICRVQGFDIEFNDCALIAWDFFIAYNLYRWVCYGDDQLTLYRRIPTYLGITLGFSLTLAIAALFDNAYGDAGLWCWIGIPGNKNKEIAWKYGGFFGWLFVVMISMIFFLVRVKQNVGERLQGAISEEAKHAYLSVVQSQVYVIIGFLVCWTPAFLNRTLSLLMNKTTIYPINIIQSITNPMFGFIHAVIFTHFHHWIAHKLQGQTTDVSTEQGGVAANFTALVDLEEREQRQFAAAKVSMFLTSIDLEWGAFANNLEQWIPAGSSIYIFTLLNCSNVRQAEEYIGRHLVKINTPLAYRSITSLANSHKTGQAQLCQFVFVSTEDVAEGHLQYNANDLRLWSQGHPLRQAVSTTLRYFETTIALVSCNTEIESEVKGALSASRMPPAGPADPSLRHARTLGLSLNHCDHTFQMGRMQQGVDIVLHSTQKARDEVHNQQPWVQALESDKQRAAVCNVVELELDRPFVVGDDSEVV